MARFHGVVGYGATVEQRPGVWVDEIIERPYFGDVIQNAFKQENVEKINQDLGVNNSISIVADAYANEHVSAIRYVQWAGALWEVASVTVQRPRLILRLGGVYNGPTPEA